MANTFGNRRSLSVKLNAIGKRTAAEVGKAVRRGAQAIADRAADSITEQTPGGRAYRSKGDKTKIHFASPPGSPPNADTGELDTGISHDDELRGPEVYRSTAGAKAPYAIPLELGSSKMAPRPFMGPAFDEVKPEVEASIRRAIIRGARSGSKK